MLDVMPRPCHGGDPLKEIESVQRPIRPNCRFLFSLIVAVTYVRYTAFESVAARQLCAERWDPCKGAAKVVRFVAIPQPLGR